MISANQSALERALRHFGDPATHDQYFQLYSDNVVLHGYPGVGPGLDAVKSFYQDAIWSAFPDASVEIQDIVEQGDKLACRFVLRGTHNGAFMGVPPTGRPIECAGMTILQFAAGKCIERWSTADFLGVLAQIGAR